MRLPTILIVGPLLALGVALPAIGTAPKQAPAGAIGMEHEEFRTETVTIVRGATITFSNDSRWLHVLGPGQQGRITAEPGAPSLGGRGAHISSMNDTWTTPPWNTPGTYHVTCSLHPEMTLTVVVTPGS